MRLSPVIKGRAHRAFSISAHRAFAIAGLILFPAFLSLPARAQTTPAPAAAALQMQAMQNMLSNNPYAQAPPGTQPYPTSNAAKSVVPDLPPALSPPVLPKSMTQDEYDAALRDSDSAQSKADRLAREAEYQRKLEKSAGIDTLDDGAPPPPQDMVDLQFLGTGAGPSVGLDDATGNPITAAADAAIDLRRDAQKEAALSFGARGGLAKRNFEIMERMKGFEVTLDRVFEFRALLVKAPAGLLIEPPIVREAIDSLVITEGGNEAAVANRIYDINKQAKIVTAPRDWRQYLIQSWTTTVPRPPRLLWPKDDKERLLWKSWVAEGWRAGSQQADEMFQSNLARLVADYNGMVRYRTLLTQGMISQPYAMHEDRGVTGTKTVMRVGDSALRITGPSQFLTGSDLWKPADR